jgi:hypothetical protein
LIFAVQISRSNPSTKSPIGFVTVTGQQLALERPTSGHTRPNSAALERSSKTRTKEETADRVRTPGPAMKPTEVIIHVYDESKNVKRDFHCKKAVILREMKYFAPIIIQADQSSDGFLDIDVHSDVQVFEALVDFCSKGVLTPLTLTLRKFRWIIAM